MKEQLTEIKKEQAKLRATMSRLKTQREASKWKFNALSYEFEKIDKLLKIAGDEVTA